MPARLRLALVGAGRWGRNYIRTIATLSTVCLARVASGNPGTRTLVPDECAIFNDWRQMLDPRELDGVIVATPPRHHAEITLRAIDLGLPVLVEKPLAMSVAEARSIRDRADARGVLVMVDHTHLFSPAYRALKSIQPQFGKVLEIKGEAASFGPFRADVPVLWDWGAHDVAMCIDLTGEVPQCVSSTILERRTVNGGLGESISVELAFASGAGAVLRLDNLSEKRRRFAVACERALLVYDDLAKQKLVVTHAECSRSIRVSDDLPLRVAVSDFAVAIAKRSLHLGSVDLGVSVTEVLTACARLGSLGAVGR